MTSIKLLWSRLVITLISADLLPLIDNGYLWLKIWSLWKIKVLLLDALDTSNNITLEQ